MTSEVSVEKKELNEFEPHSVSPNIITQVDKYDLNTLEYETLVQMGIEVSEAKIYAQWVLGKLGDAVSKKYGDLVKYANEIRQKYEVLNQYIYTYRKFINEDPNFSPDKYSGSVPWGVLQLVATKTKEPQKLLDKLQDKGLEGSISSAYKGVMDDQHGSVAPAKPRVKFTWDYKKKKFRVTLDSNTLDLWDWGDVVAQARDRLEAMM